jgi:CheY-like chemotaxis protein
VARILVVDDDPSVRALLRDVLELDGHTVSDVVDGYAALRAVAAERPDCVVLDVVMPGMDGHEVLGRLRATPGGLELPVVMLTASADDETAWRGWSGGVDHVLGKPFDADELLGLLEGLCARPGPRALCGRSTGPDGRRC